MKPGLPLDLFNHASQFRLAVGGALVIATLKNDAVQMAHWRNELEVFDRVMGELTAYANGLEPDEISPLTGPDRSNLPAGFNPWEAVTLHPNPKVPPGLVVVVERKTGNMIHFGAVNGVSERDLKSWPAGTIMHLSPQNHATIKRAMAAKHPLAPRVPEGVPIPSDSLDRFEGPANDE